MSFAPVAAPPHQTPKNLGSPACPYKVVSTGAMKRGRPPQPTRCVGGYCWPECVRSPALCRSMLAVAMVRSTEGILISRYINNIH